MLGAEGTHVFLGQVGVQLDLVDRRGDLAFGVQPPQVVRLKVRDADRAGSSVAVELLQGVPGRHVIAVVPGGQRPVDQEQVYVVEAERVQRVVERLTGVIRAVEAIVQLAGNEHVGAVKAGLADGLADLLLIAVHLGGIDVPVPRLQGRSHGPGGVFRLDLKDTEAELWDLLAVVQHDERYCAHGISSGDGWNRWIDAPPASPARCDFFKTHAGTTAGPRLGAKDELASSRT